MVKVLIRAVEWREEGHRGGTRPAARGDSGEIDGGKQGQRVTTPGIKAWGRMRSSEDSHSRRNNATLIQDGGGEINF